MEFYNIYTQEGDSLLDIAMREYGVSDGVLWLLEDNPGVLSAMTDVPAPHTLLNIRKDPDVSDLQKLNYVRKGKEYTLVKIVQEGTGGSSDPATVKNYDNSYNVSAEPGTILTLPNETIANSDSSWSINKPSVKNYTIPDTPVKDSAGTTIFNQPSAVAYTVADSQVRKADGATVAKAIKATQYCLTADVLAAMSAAEIHTDLNTNGQLAALLLAVSNAELLADLSDAQKGAIIAAASNAILNANLTAAQKDYITTILSDSNLDNLTSGQVAYIVSTLGATEIALLTNAQLDLLDDTQMTYIKGKFLLLPADFSVSDDTPTQGQILNFTAGITGADSWFWNFGDGNTSTLQNPTHSYASTGTFDVTLLAGKKSNSKCAYVVKLALMVVAAATGFAFDSISGLYRVYSLTRVFGSYVGFALRVRRSSDNTWVDVAFDSTNVVSDSSPVSNGGVSFGDLVTWAGTDIITVEIWYDQTTNNKPLSQTTGSLQPKLTKIGSKYCVLSDGVDDYMTDSTFTPAFPVVANFIGYVIGTSGGVFGGLDSGTWTFSMTMLGSPARLGADSNVQPTAAKINITQNTWMQVEAAYNITSGTGIINLNRGADVSGADSTTAIGKLVVFKDRFQSGNVALRELVIGPSRNSYIGDNQKSREGL